MARSCPQANLEAKHSLQAEETAETKSCGGDECCVFESPLQGMVTIYQLDEVRIMWV